MVDSISYPAWFYYPSRTRPPDWVHELLGVVEAARPLIDSATVDELTSDKVLAHLRPGLLKLGYEVEGGKHRAEKIRRPVLFGDQGRERVPTRSTPSTTSSASWWRSKPVAAREATPSTATWSAPRSSSTSASWDSG